MADRTMLSFEVDEDLNERIHERVRDGGYATVGEYVRALIEQDDDRFPEPSESDLAILRQAFATPSADCVYVTAQDVIERGRARRRA